MDPEPADKTAQPITEVADETRRDDSVERLLKASKRAKLSRRTRQGVPSGSPDQLRSIVSRH